MKEREPPPTYLLTDIRARVALWAFGFASSPLRGAAPFAVPSVKAVPYPTGNHYRLRLPWHELEVSQCGTLLFDAIPPMMPFAGSSRDRLGLLTQAGALALSRDAQNGLLTATALGNETEGLTYNAYGEQTDFHAAYPAGLDYAVHYDRDAVGRIVTKTETVNGTVTAWTYGYDVAGRLSDVLKDGAVYAHYDYDPNGNRLDKTNGAGTIVAAGTYDNQDRMLNYGTNTYAYTANGELTAKTDNTTGKVTTYQYDVLGNLKHVNLPDGTAIDYVIDGRNRRIAKKVNGTLTESYLYDGQLRPVATLDASGNVVSRFVYATHINMPDYMIKGGVTYKIITDHLGSPRFIIDSSTGTIAQRMDYDDFGNVTLDTSPGFTPFGFAGGLYDSQTKLVRFGARDYDAETGRWTSKDPIIFAGSQSNLFAYALSDPINRGDSDGMIVWWIPVVVVGAAVAAIVILPWLAGTVENAKAAAREKECSKCHGRTRPKEKPKLMACHYQPESMSPLYHDKVPTMSPWPESPFDEPSQKTDPTHMHGGEPNVPGVGLPRYPQDWERVPLEGEAAP